MPHIHVSYFVLTSFSGSLVTFVSYLVTRHPLQPMLSTGSEHQGQNSISDPHQNLGFTCIFSSGMQEFLFLCLPIVYHPVPTLFWCQVYLHSLWLFSVCSSDILAVPNHISLVQPPLSFSNGKQMSIFISDNTIFAPFTAYSA